MVNSQSSLLVLNISEARDYRVLANLSARYARLGGRFQGITELVRRSGQHGI